MAPGAYVGQAVAAPGMVPPSSAYAISRYSQIIRPWPDFFSPYGVFTNGAKKLER